MSWLHTINFLIAHWAAIVLAIVVFISWALFGLAIILLLHGIRRR
jgi:hypothetical protein